jgi:hypothetical protein
MMGVFPALPVASLSDMYSLPPHLGLRPPLPGKSLFKEHTKPGAGKNSRSARDQWWADRIVFGPRDCTVADPLAAVALAQRSAQKHRSTEEMAVKSSSIPANPSNG